MEEEKSIRRVDAYMCPNCDEFHKTAKEVLDCMSDYAPEKEAVWECKHCGDLWHEAVDAKVCCQKQV